MRPVVRTDDGLVLRLWTKSNKADIERIVAVSQDEFDQWLPGMMQDLGNLDAFLDAVQRMADEGTGWYYAVEVGGTVVGQCNINTRDGGAAEIGYWIETDRTNQGIATRAVVAVCEEAAGHGFTSLIIRCDEGNVRSAAVARKAGFTHTGTETLDPTLPSTLSQTGREMTWRRETR